MEILAENWHIWMLVLWLAPLVGAVLQISIGKYLPREGDWLCIAAIGTSFMIAFFSFLEMLSKGDPNFSKAASFTWIPAAFGENLPGLEMGFLVDNITIIMLIVVTSVSFLVHIYSMGYMEGDEKYPRFFAYLNLFSFSMLGLVLVDNLVGLYIFWELVGLCSYLLIGFWYEDPSLDPARASIKAFLTTRVGDIGMFIGILLITVHIGEYNYIKLFEAVANGGPSGGFTGGTIFGISYTGYQLWSVAGVMVFMGAVGKSAQFPLHIWLPDAMEGPTPVSALIHAATMVAAGVYMVSRLFVFFSPSALLVIGLFGGFTAFFAATMALVNDDIKGVLAYSTISQLGYMVMALGIGGWLAGFYHLFTHAYFKALLFLCSGSVIHAVHTNDMKKMGGLWKKMPWTFGTMLIATLSIAGVPLFSGFLTKEMILFESLKVWLSSGTWVDFLFPLFGFGAAVLTVFYMFRLIFMTFTGDPADEETYEHAHESPWSMVVPMVVIAFLSFFWAAGSNPMSKEGLWFKKIISKPTLEQYKHKSASRDQDQNERVAQRAKNRRKASRNTHEKTENKATSTSLGVIWASIGVASKKQHKSSHDGSHSDVEHKAHSWTFMLSLLAVAVGFLVAAGGYWQYIQFYDPGTIAGVLSPIHQLLKNNYYIDEIAFYGVVKPGIDLSRFLAANIDLRIIDAVVDEIGELWVGSSLFAGWLDGNFIDRLALGLADFFGGIGERLRKIQTGDIRLYLGLIGGGILGIMGVLFAVLNLPSIQNSLVNLFYKFQSLSQLRAFFRQNLTGIIIGLALIGLVLVFVIRYWRNIKIWIRFAFTGK